MTKATATKFIDAGSSRRDVETNRLRVTHPLVPDASPIQARNEAFARVGECHTFHVKQQVVCAYVRCFDSLDHSFGVADEFSLASGLVASLWLTPVCAVQLCLVRPRVPPSARLSLMTRTEHHHRTPGRGATDVHVRRVDIPFHSALPRTQQYIGQALMRSSAAGRGTARLHPSSQLVGALTVSQLPGGGAQFQTGPPISSYREGMREVSHETSRLVSGIPGSTRTATHSTDGAIISTIFAEWGLSVLARRVASELVAGESDGPVAAGRNRDARARRTSTRQGSAGGHT